MSLATGFLWTYKTHRLLGYSVAGLSTSLVFPEADVCFDVAQGLPFQMGTSNLLISHAHMDHAAGIPYVVAMKSMTGAAKPTFYMPESLLEPMHAIMAAWAKAESHAYDYRFEAARDGVEYSLKGGYCFKPFTTSHRVPSQGYTVFEKRKRLKPELAGLARGELMEIKRQGGALEDYSQDPLISFTGDTRIEFLDMAPHVALSKILVMEVTFFDDQKSVENARHWGHIHLEELLPRLDSIRSERIVLIHASARYTSKQLKAILDDRIPEQHKTRVQLFPRPI